MFTITLDPIIFQVGHFVLRWYAVIFITAMTVAIWIIFAGIMGARLFHVLDHWSYEYALNPIRALYIWEGGLAPGHGWQARFCHSPETNDPANPDVLVHVLSDWGP